MEKIGNALDRLLRRILRPMPTRTRCELNRQCPPGGEYHFQDVPHYHPLGAMRIEAALQDRAVERTQPTWKFRDRVRIHSAPARRKRQLCGAERVALRFGVNDL